MLFFIKRKFNYFVQLVPLDQLITDPLRVPVQHPGSFKNWTEIVFPVMVPGEILPSPVLTVTEPFPLSLITVPFLYVPINGETAGAETGVGTDEADDDII